MTSSNPIPEELLDNHGKGEVNNELALKAIDVLAKAAGFDSEELLNALEGIKTFAPGETRRQALPLRFLL